MSNAEDIDIEILMPILFFVCVRYLEVRLETEVE
jgi:hypothetical protein